jgi:hypothetical protein
MNKQLLHQSANAWVEQAKRDIASKIREFSNESGISLPQMANDLGIDINELNNILNGGVPSMKTFAILMIASGIVMELKPVEESQFAPAMGGGFPMPGGAPMPPMGQHRPGRPAQPAPSIFDDFHRQPAPEPVAAPIQQPRAANGQFRPWPKNRQGAPMPGAMPMPGMPPIGGQQRPPFANMGREELVQIVRQHLWHNEIDLANVSREQLVRFLEDKDRQFNELQNGAAQGGQPQGIAVDPSVVQLKEKLKKTLDKNPHLRGFLKDIFDE